MIFVDANSFLRALVRPVTPQDQVMTEEASALLRAAAIGQAELTTSEAVLAEVAFALSSPKHYNLAPPDVSARLKPVLQLRGLRLPRKRLYLRALDVWSSTPTLGFVDALTVAYAERPGVDLATFDADVDPIPGIRRYRRTVAK